jgi:transposase
VLEVERWAEIGAMQLVGGLSVKGVARRTGHSRNTIRAALRSAMPPSYGPRAPRPSRLDPFKPQIDELLGADGDLPSRVVGERIAAAGYEGGETILDDYVRELRPILSPPRSFQRTGYRPGELVRFDLREPGEEIPVGHGQTRRGFVVSCCSGYSRAGAAALVFSKQADDVLWGMSRCLAELGALPEKLVWDREGAIHRGGGRPTSGFAALCAQLGVGWIILDPGDCQAKGALERLHDFLERSFEPARGLVSALDYQDRLRPLVFRARQPAP